MQHLSRQGLDQKMMTSTYNVWRQVGIPTLSDANEQRHLYALVDGAQVMEYRRHFLNVPGIVNQLALLGADMLPDRVNASVHLLHLENLDVLNSLLHRLTVASTSHGALSLLVTKSPLDVLANALRLRLDVTLFDQFDCTNRYFDGRVAPHWVGCLTTEQKERFCAFASEWWVVSHEHAWQQLARNELHPDPFTTPFVINEAQQASMIDACYPYAVIDHLNETDPELLERVAPAAQYKWFCDALQVAEGYGIDGGPEAMLFCTLTLTRGQLFYLAPAWRDGLLKLKKRQTRLADLMKAI